MSGVCTWKRRIVSFALVLITIILFGLFTSDSKVKLNSNEKLSTPSYNFQETNSHLNLTESEHRAFNKFQRRTRGLQLKDPSLQLDQFLVKWLESTGFNVSQAEDLLTQNLKWKKENNIFTIQSEDFSDFASGYECNVDKEDSERRPVLYLNIGEWDIKQATKSGRKETLQRYVNKWMDQAVNLVYDKYKENEAVHQFILLIQLDGFTFFKGMCLQCMDVYEELFKLYEHHYPRMGYKIIIINTPDIFSAVTDKIKSILSDSSRQNLHVFSGPSEWEEFFLNLGLKIEPPNDQSEFNIEDEFGF